MIAVIGAGAAGMMAAYSAAIHGAEVVLAEKKNNLGSKLKITGQGRCNITSSLEREHFLQGYANNGKFMHRAFHAFSNLDLMSLLESSGLPLKIERGNRVFPLSDRAEDVVDVLLSLLEHNKVKIRTGVNVTGIRPGEPFRISTNQGNIRAGQIVVATGGLSYPGTGSTGDGYKWAQNLGHTIVDLRPGLVPLVAEETWVKSLQGLSLKNVKVKSFTSAGRHINGEFGEMLFTHFGVSGPVILSMSGKIAEYLDKTGDMAKLVIDLKPAMEAAKLDERIRRDWGKNSRKQFKNSLKELLPNKLIPVIIDLSGIEPEKECHQITRAERLHLGEIIKGFTLTIISTRPVTEAIVTAGGIKIQEIDPGTMESKLINNLYFAGEILDIDGYTGGFNLQAAFSTGYLAGKSAAHKSMNLS